MPTLSLRIKLLGVNYMITALSFGLIAIAIILLTVVRKQAQDFKHLQSLLASVILHRFKIERLQKQVFPDLTKARDQAQFEAWFKRQTEQVGGIDSEED